MIVNNEVTLSRKNCKINTIQSLFRGWQLTYYILEKNGPCGECIFKNRKDTESHTFTASQTTITEITQEEFDEYLITNIISLDNERKETKTT